MAYDAARGVIVLFGGATSDGIYSGETWDLGVPCVAPSISTQPVAQTACLGGSASFTVTAGGAPNSYQWRKSGANLADEPNHISGAHAAMLLIVNITPADAGSGMGGYDCIVENPCGSATSNTAALTVNVAPSITQQPTGQSILSGGTATFTVAASAPPAGGALAYQWRRNGVALADGPFGNGSVVHGAATPFLALTSVALADNTAAFDCIVTNTCGSTTSFPAGLSVMSSCTADFNHDGIVNSQDFFDFVAAFFAGCGH
jgi:hypothetical protein